MGKRVAGTCHFTIDGKQYDLEGNIEATMAKKKRETKKGISGRSFYSEEDVTPSVKGSFFVPEEFDMGIFDNDNLSISVEFANGKSCWLSGAYHVDEAMFKGADGTTDLQFDGEDGDWN